MNYIVRAIAWVLLATCWAACGNVALGSISEAGTGAFFIVRSDTDTPYSKASANVDLSLVDIRVPGDRPVPYFFLGAFDATGYNAEAGIYYDAAADGWRPFAMIAGGTNGLGEAVTGWSEPQDLLIDPTDHIQLVYEVLDDAARYSIINWTEQTTATYDVAMAESSLWGDRTAYNRAGQGISFYRETSLAFDAGAEDFFGTEAYFTGAYFHDAFLYNESETMRWDASRTDWAHTSAYPTETGIVSMTSSPDFSSNFVDFHYGRGATSGESLAVGTISLPEPAAVWLLVVGLGFWGCCRLAKRNWGLRFARARRNAR